MNTVISINYGKKEQNVGSEDLLTFDDLDRRRSSLSTSTWAVLMFIGYIILGLLFFVYNRGLSPLDAVYLSVITFTTVGYGDIKIDNRLFSTFYVLLGAGIVGTYFGIFSNEVMSAQERMMQKRLVSAANAMSEMLSERARELKKNQREKIKQYYSELSELRSKSGLDKVREQMYKFYLEKLTKEDSEKMKSVNMQIYEDELRELRSKGFVDGFFVFFSLFSGTICMMFIERWTFVDSFYWASVTATTVGYGDVTPNTTAGKVFTIFYTIVACSLAAKGFGDIVRYPLVMREKENELYITEQFGEEITERTLKCILNNKFFDRIPNLRKNDKQLVKSEFVLLVLQMINKVQDKDIILASQVFDRLDSAADGVLDEADQLEQLRKARERDQIRDTLERERRQKELLLQQQAQGTGFGAGLGSLASVLNPVNIIIIPGFTPSTRTRTDTGGQRRKYSSPPSHQQIAEDDEESHVFHDAVTNPMIVEQREAALSRKNTPKNNARASKQQKNEPPARDDFDDDFL